MACETRRSEQIADFAGGRVAGASAQELLGHLLACEACSAEFELAARLVELPAQEPALAAGGHPPGARRPRLLRRVLPLLAAAAILLLFLTRGPAPGISSLAELEPLPFAPGTLRGDGPEEARARAMQHYQAGRYDEAERVLGALGSEDPDDALSRFYRGLCLLQLERREEARAPLQAAAEVGQGLLRERALWYLANLELALEDGQRARQVLERLVALEGEYAFDAAAKLEALRALLE